MSYQYSYSTDFSSNFNQSQFHQEVAAEAGITRNIERVDMEGDIVTVVFESSLSGAEHTLLNNLVANHIPNTSVGNNIINLSVSDQTVAETTFVNIGSIVVPGSKIWDITNICVVSVMESGGTSYDIKIVDTTNNNLIVTKNFTNTVESNNDLTPITNLPTSTAILEIQCKVNGSTVAHVKNVNLFYFN